MWSNFVWIKNIIDTFGAHHNQTFVVVDSDGKLTGIITLEHLKETLLLGDFAESMLAMDIMDKPEYTCSPEMSLPEVYEKFSETDTDAMPVVGSEGTVYGVAEKFAVDHYLHTRIIELHRKLESLG